MYGMHMRHRDACSYIDFSVTLHDREKLSESERERERQSVRGSKVSNLCFF